MPFGAKLVLDHVMQDWRDLIARIDVPTLVTGGEVSHVAPTSQEWLAAQIPGARLRIFTRAEGGAHFPFFEQPAPFAEALRGFHEELMLGAEAGYDPQRMLSPPSTGRQTPLI